MSKNTLAQPCAWLNHFSSNHGNGNIWVPQTPRHVLLFIVSILKTHFIFSGGADKPSFALSAFCIAAITEELHVSYGNAGNEACPHRLGC